MFVALQYHNTNIRFYMIYITLLSLNYSNLFFFFLNKIVNINLIVSITNLLCFIVFQT